MAHSHFVYDNDKHFSIDPVTREIVNESGKFVLIKNDHNSERFTFEIPREVDGHDMSLCNVVQVHYLNIEASEDGLTYEGLYGADDLQISPDGEDAVIFSWLISRNATQYVGNLSFSVYFACVADDGTVEYAWSTGVYSKVNIGEAIYNSDVLALEYADIFEKWRKETFDMVQGQIDSAVEGEFYVKKAGDTMTGNLNIPAPTEAAHAVNKSYVDGKRIAANVTLGTAWSNSAPYSQTLYIDGILAKDTPHISVAFSEALETAKAQAEAFACVSRAKAAVGSIIFYCFEEKPDIAIPLQIEVLR